MSLFILGLTFIGAALLLVFRTERMWPLRRRRAHTIDPDALMRRKNHVVRQTYSYFVAVIPCGLMLFSGFPGGLALAFVMLAWGVYIYLMWMHLIRSVQYLRSIDPAEYVRRQRAAQFDAEADYTVGADGELERVR